MSDEFPATGFPATESPEPAKTAWEKIHDIARLRHLSIRNIRVGSALMARLLYGSGLRLSECLRLRVKDIEFDMQQIIVRNGKGETDRVTILPNNLIDPLRRHLAKVQMVHDEDLNDGVG